MKELVMQWMLELVNATSEPGDLRGAGCLKLRRHQTSSKKSGGLPYDSPLPKAGYEHGDRLHIFLCLRDLAESHDTYVTPMQNVVEWKKEKKGGG